MSRSGKENPVGERNTENDRFVFRSSRLTADVLKKAMKMYLEHWKAAQQATHGKMSVKDYLIDQGMGV